MLRRAVAVLAVPLLVGCGGGAGAGPTASKRTTATTPGSHASAADPGARAVEHLRAIARLTQRAGGDREASTDGDEALAGYARGVLEAAGYTARLEPVEFPFFEERSTPRVRIGGRSVGDRREVAALTYSPSGTVRGRLVAIAYERPDSGCRRSDYARLPRGAVVLAGRGICEFRRKARLAERAGATAVLVADRESPDAPPATLGEPGTAQVPVLGVGSRTGRRLRAAAGRTVSVKVDAVSERRTGRNVIAESPAVRAGEPVVMVGGHTDSVRRGPGLNDNGSGVASSLAAAEALADEGVPLRIGLWTAEELGLYGSRAYVRKLGASARRRIRAYVNLDMVGSPHPVPFVYGRVRIREALARGLRARDLRAQTRSLGGGSDHAPFLRAGIPAGGIYTGSDERKTAAQARRYGGKSGEPLDPCYHRPCDSLANVDLPSLRAATEAVVDALEALAAR